MTRTAVKLGAFLLLCTSLTLVLATTIGNTTIGGLLCRGPLDAVCGGPDTYTLRAAFDDASGLLVNDNVKISGVPVGKVTGIRVEKGQAVVTMEVRDSYVLASDSAAAIRWRNLIGQRYLYLVPGDAPTTLTDGDMITETTNVVDLGELFNRLGPIVAAVDPAQVNDFLDTVTAALDGNQADVSVALDDLAFVARSLGERDAAIGRLIENLEVVSRTVADRDQQIQVMLDNLAVLAQTFTDNTALLESALIEMGAFGRDLSKILDANTAEIDRLIVNLAATVGTVGDNLDPIETVLANLDETAAGIFNTSRNGTFLNQAILCLTVTTECPYPIVSGLDQVTSSSSQAVPYAADNSRGPAAVLSLVGGSR